MTSEQLYYQFHLLVNKNHQDDNINISRGNFVILYNREAKSWLYKFLNDNKKSDDILYLNELRVKDFALSQISSEKNYNVYQLPSDYSYLVYGDCHSEVYTKDCVKVIYNRLTKPDNQNEYHRNEYLKPKIEWERGMMDLSGDKLYVYKNDFQINYTHISYYKELTQIDLAGYFKELGDIPIRSTNIDPVESDWILERVLDNVVLEVMRQFENSNGFQLSKDRVK